MNNLNSNGKNSKLCLNTILLVFLLSSAYLVYGFTTDPLPNNIKIYVNEQGEISLESAEGYVAKKLPVHNLSVEAPGCYLACYSTNPERGLYKASTEVYVMGLVRVAGQYDGSFCRPSHYEKLNIKDERSFKELCSKIHKCIGNSCWAGADTGELFGLK